MRIFGGFNRTIKISISLVDMFVYHLAFLVSFYVRYGERPIFNYSAYRSALIYILIAFTLINVFSGIYTLYNKKTIDMFSTTLISQLMMSVIIMAMTYFGRWFAFPRTIIGISLIVSTIFLTIWRIIVLEYYMRSSGMSRVMIVGPEEMSKEAIYNIDASRTIQYKVTAVAYSDYFNHIKENINDIDVFYLLDFESRLQEEQILSYLTLHKKRIFLSNRFENILRVNNRIMNIDDESIIAISKFEISPENDTIKIMIDFLISLILIVLTSPVMLITALLIKLTSKGPILYKQIRITKGNKEFEIYKFRTMRIDAEDLSGPVLAQSEDPRITKIGKHLRSLRIDELPQLFNVLKGEMSLIGPRPERPFFVEQFNEENPYYYLRHNVRAGITGYAQVYGKYSTTFYNKLKFDLVYIKNYSLILDLQILFQTVKILFDKVSSQGLEDMTLKDYQISEDIKIFK